MVRPVEVRPLAGYRLWLRYQDGTEGEVDLSHLVGRGVFVSWTQEGEFAKVKLGPQPASLPRRVTAKHEVLVNINTLAILSGGLPARALGLVTEWASLHQPELLASWERASQLQPPGKIAPLP
jgi:hypothetical protein